MRQLWRGAIFFIKHIPKFIIFGTHNLQTFKHNTLINKLLLMQLFLLNIRPKLHFWKWRKLRVNFTSSLLSVDVVVHPTFIRKLCYKLPSDDTFTFIDFWPKFCLLYWMAPCCQAVWGVIFKICVRPIFGVRFERRKVDKKANLHENWSMQTLFQSILNISSKCRQNRSL